MKVTPSLSLVKMTVRLLLLLILIVIMFMISSVLYSARYWPDIYNYINANITIKRIPTLSELNLTIIEVEYMTETYTTTDVYYTDISTIDDFDLDAFNLDEVEIKNQVKRSILIEKTKDYIELPSRGIFIDYVFLEEPITTVKNDIINEFKAVSNEEPVTSIDAEVSKTQKILFYIPSMKTEHEVINNVDNDNVEGTLPVTLTKLVKSNKVRSTVPEKISVITTKEGYIVGDEKGDFKNRKLELFEDETKQIDFKTETNENDEFDEDITIRIMKDLIDESKLIAKNSKDVEMFTGKPEKMVQKTLEPMCHGNSTCDDFVLSVFPWIVAIFIKDGVSSQFSYYCDGALLSDRIILTDARCVRKSNKTLDNNDILVFLGKGSLQVMNGNEKIQKIKEVIVHDNFTLGGKTSNDLALLVMEESMNLSNNIQSACVEDRNNDPVEISATTAWALNGELLPIFFNKEKSDTCYDKDENIFCATYGNDVALCPSYGGVYAVKRSEKWCLQGIFYGDPAERGICFSKNVFYTSLKNYLRWIDSVVDINKNYL